MKNLLKYLLIIVSLNATGAVVQEKGAVIQVKLIGDIQSVEELSLTYTPKYIYMMENTVKIKMKPSKEGIVKFYLPDISSLNKIRGIGVLYNEFDQAGNRYYDRFLEYVILPGDDIVVTIEIQNRTVKHASFSGRGSLKYSCRYLLESLGRRLSDSVTGAYEAAFKRHGKDVNIYYPKLALFSEPSVLKSLTEPYRNYKKVMLDSLQNHKENLPPDVYEIYKTDIIGYLSNNYELQFPFYQERSDTSDVSKIANFYFGHPFELEPASSQSIPFSPYYINAVYQQLETAELFSGKYKSSIAIPVKRLFDQINRNYVGELRDRLLMTMILDAKKQVPLALLPKDSAVFFLSKAIAVISNPDIKKKIENATILKTKPGSTPFNFTLADTKGKMISLSEFKGKVVLMDMWFTGCGACARLNERLKKEVYPKFANTDKFEIISIGTDYDRLKWLKSVNTKIYTDDESVNLHLPPPDKIFSNADMVKYYGLIGLPFSLLIGMDGKIISEISNVESTDEIIRKITLALNDTLLP